jgi:hypothetical protein
MNFKFPILIAAGLLIAGASKAQYNRSYNDNRVAIQGQFAIPGRVVIGYNYNSLARDRYDEHRDWRADEYERYCRDHRDYRGDRRDYYQDRYEYRGDRRDNYRDRYDYRAARDCAPRQLVVYGY